MFPLSQVLKIAGGAAILALSIANHAARADELVQHLGPVSAEEPIVTTVGNERLIAFYEPDNGQCALNAVVYDKTDPDTGMTTAARLRVSLAPGQTASIDSADNKSLTLRCGDQAESLALVSTDRLVASK